MQFAELMRLFREGQNEGRKRGYVMQGSCDAEGVRFVVRALRDAICKQYGFQKIWDDFDSILGSDAVEKVAGGSTREDECGLQGQVTPSPATAPAPAVCEWRANEYEGAYSPGCETPAVWYSDGSETPQKEGYNFCPSCGKPIKFTEAKT